jgi:hypothetical protein
MIINRKFIIAVIAIFTRAHTCLAEQGDLLAHDIKRAPAADRSEVRDHHRHGDNYRPSRGVGQRM